MADRRFSSESDQTEGTDQDVNNPANRASSSREMDQLERVGQSSQSVSDGREVNDRESTPDTNWQYNPGTNKSTATKSWSSRFSFLRRRKGIVGIIASILAMVTGFAFFTPTLAPFAALNAVYGDLNDQLAATEIRSNHIFRQKIAGAQAASQTVRGCATLSIKCKFRTLSTSEIKRLQRAGIEVKYREAKFGRNIPSEFKFNDKTFTPEQWRRELQTNQRARNAQLRANNMKFIGFSDRSFVSKVLNRFGLSKKPVGLKGSASDRLNQILTAAGQADFKDVRFVSINGDDKEPYRLEGADGKVIDEGPYGDKDVKRIKDDIERWTDKETPRTVTPRAKVAVGTLSAFGFADLACTLRNMIGTAAITGKVMIAADTAGFSWDTISQIHRIQAGDGTPEDFEALGKFFQDPDNRQRIADLAATFSANTSEDRTQAMKDGEITELDAIMKDNPNYQRRALDSELMLMSINGGVAPNTRTASIFSLGGGGYKMLSWIDNFSQVSLALSKVGGVDGCKIVQHPLTRGVGILATVVMAFTSFGTITAGQLALAGSMIAGIYTFSVILDSLVNGSVLSVLGDMNETVARGDAFWTGAAVINSTAAQARGMKPSSSSEIAQYQSSRDTVSRSYLAMENSRTNPLDITSPYSTLSIVTHSIRSSIGYNTGLLASLFSSPAMIQSALVDLSGVSAVSSERFTKCDDESLAEVGIDADVQCNIRYTMSDAELAMNPLDVANYMEAKGYVEPDTETGLPAGYTPPDPYQEQNALVGFLRGMTIGQLFDDSDLPRNDYAYFLEYCAYRTIPFGEDFTEDLIGSAPRKWKTGEKCTEDSEMLSNFRVYTMDKSVEEGLSEDAPDTVKVIDRGDYESDFTSHPEGTVPTGNGWTLANDYDYSAVPCADGTEDIGTYQHPMHKFTIRRCNIDGIPVASLISRGLVAMIKDAKERENITLKITSGHRTYEHQQKLYYERCVIATCAPGSVAVPGFSLHERGIAVDLNNMCFAPSVLVPTCPSSDEWNYMVVNASRYGFYQYKSEAWHWQPN